MKTGRPARPVIFGEINPLEQAIVQEIIFLREKKKMTFKAISDYLNAEGEGHLPKRAARWTIILVHHQYKSNKPGRMGMTVENNT